MTRQSFRLFLLLIGVSLSGCNTKPVKTVDYFKYHPEEVQTEAKRCVEEVKSGKSISDDKTCDSVLTIQHLRCENQQRIVSAWAAGLINCDNPNQLLVMAATGF